VNRGYKSGEDAFTLCEFSYAASFGGKTSFIVPIGYLFADRSHVAGGGETITGYYARRCGADGGPKGLALTAAQSRKTVKGRPATIVVLTARETLGLERKSEIVEAAIPGDGPLPADGRLFDSSFDAGGGTGVELKYQLKNDDPAARAIVFEVPSVPASGSAAFHFVLADAVR